MNENRNETKDIIFLKFHFVMTCVAINAKEGDCWTIAKLYVVFDVTQMSYQHCYRVAYLHIYFQIEYTEFSWSAKQFSVSTEHFCLYPAVIVFIKITQALKEF